MDVRQLAALVAVAQTGSVTRAADVLHLVQPAVSRQIRLLEDELGVPLFERTRQGMRLTDDGQVLLEHARRALSELERARAEIRPASGELRGVVTLGLSPSFAEPISEALVRRLAAEHPAVRPRLSIGYTRHLADWLDAADIDLAVIYEVRPSSAIETRVLLDEALWVVGPPGSDLSPDRPVRFRDVHERVRIQPSPTHAMRTMLERVAAEQNIALTVAVETNSMDVQQRLASAGVGYTVLPSIAVAKDVERGHLSGAPLLDDGLRRRLRMALPRTRRLGYAVRGVAELLIEEMRRSVESGAWPSARWLAEPGAARIGPR
ncbi:LysR family transcriptional regulator [Pseudonocardia acaciae]|uniref:LysR family transcriptional regulator n=1 Tax=Pseudonocardia acaciae TaxID=551276 RepID=UPI00048ABC3E|nr:LysR family transcriptional regulator [Pseudonocardia acaciae]